jgi:protein TonB
MRSGQEGWVTLEFTVTETGAVIDPWVTDAEPADVFDAAAIAAVRQWRFKPRIANGRAAAVRSSVTLRFEVDR